MPATSIAGASVRYEIFGDGPTIVLIPGGRQPLEAVVPLAHPLADRHRVILWDRANLGASDVCFAGATDLDLWTDQLQGLLERLDGAPAVLAAASSGARVALRMAMRQPRSVRGLFLWLLSAGEVARSLAHNYYGEAAEVAAAHGMTAVVELSYWAERIAANPANRGRLLSEDPALFAEVMQRWAAAIRPQDALIGVPDADLARVGVPTRIVAGADDAGHKRSHMETAARLIAGAELIDPPGFREEWLAIRAASPLGTGYERIPQLAGLIDRFMGDLTLPRP